jgi:plasmid rolling circle replication initiator protein Rep
MKNITREPPKYKPPKPISGKIFKETDKIPAKARLTNKRSITQTKVSASMKVEARQARINFDHANATPQERLAKEREYNALMAEAESFQKRAERQAQCGRYLGVTTCPDYHTKKVVHASLCHDRMCPLCNYLRAERLSSKFNKVITKIIGDAENPPDDKKIYGDRFIHIGATIPNPPDGALKAVHRILGKASAMFFRHKTVKRFVLGSARSIEITRKHGSWHPHCHFLLNVHESYFSPDNPYARAPQGPLLWMNIWVSILEKLNWRKYYPVEYQAKDEAGNYVKKITDFKMNAVKKGNEHKSAVEVTAKYIVKDEELNRLSTVQTVEFMRAVYGARLWITTGSMRVTEKEIEKTLIEGANAEEIEIASEYCPVCGQKLVYVDMKLIDGRYQIVEGQIRWALSKKQWQCAEHFQRLRRGERTVMTMVKYFRNKKPVAHRSTLDALFHSGGAVNEHWTEENSRVVYNYPHLD